VSAGDRPVVAVLSTGSRFLLGMGSSGRSTPLAANAELATDMGGVRTDGLDAELQDSAISAWDWPLLRYSSTSTSRGVREADTAGWLRSTRNRAHNEASLSEQAT
jgi:hypothetical protein